MRKTLWIAALALAVAAPGLAQQGSAGGNGRMQGDGQQGTGNTQALLGAGNGAGMIAVADDSSVLVTSNVPQTSTQVANAELFNIGADGLERWRLVFEQSRLTQPQTAGSLVLVQAVVPLRTAQDPGSGSMRAGTGAAFAEAELVALDLTSGAELWSFVPEQPARMTAMLSEDGAMVYVVVTEVAGLTADEADEAGLARRLASTLYAFDSTGVVLWTLELGVS